MTKILVAIIFILSLALVVTNLDKFKTTSPVNSFEECVAAGNPVMESHPRRCRANGQTFTEQIDATPAPIVSMSGNIKVTGPVANQEVSNPLTITGEARVFENAFSYRLVDANKKVLLEGHAMANAPDVGQFGPFSVTINYENPETPTGEVVVFAYSAKDGSEVDKVAVPVTFTNE